MVYTITIGTRIVKVKNKDEVIADLAHEVSQHAEKTVTIIFPDGSRIETASWDA